MPDDFQVICGLIVGENRRSPVSNETPGIFRWGTHLYMSLYPSVRPSVRRAPYLRNRTSYDHNFWYTYVNDVFHFFKILIFWAFREVKG